MEMWGGCKHTTFGVTGLALAYGRNRSVAESNTDLLSYEMCVSPMRTGWCRYVAIAVNKAHAPGAGRAMIRTEQPLLAKWKSASLR